MFSLFFSGRRVKGVGTHSILRRENALVIMTSPGCRGPARFVSEPQFKPQASPECSGCIRAGKGAPAGWSNQSST